VSRYVDGIDEGDLVELTYPVQTLSDPGRMPRMLPTGTQGMVERRSSVLLRLVVSDPNPADGLHDAAVVGVSRVRKVGTVA
jgi:hypothetical protein